MVQSAPTSLGLAAMSRSPGATLSLSGSGVLNATTVTGNTNGLLGAGLAFATVGGNFWLTANGGSIVESGSRPDEYVRRRQQHRRGRQRLSDPLHYQLPPIRLGCDSLTLNDTNTVQSGGILVTSNIAGTPLPAESLASGVNELIVHAYGDITINSAISAGNGLTKSGSGTLTLGGAKRRFDRPDQRQPR